jgi:hypothetical protein
MIMLLWPGSMLRRAGTIVLHTVLTIMDKSRIATLARMALKSEMMRKLIANAAMRLVTNHWRA